MSKLHYGKLAMMQNILAEESNFRNSKDHYENSN